MRPHLSSPQQNSQDHWLKRGAELMHANKYQAACSCYTQAIQKFPNNAYFHYCKGVAHHQNKEFIEAASSYSNALQINPKLVEAFENLAAAQIELQLFKDALLSARAALTLQPDSVVTNGRLAIILIRLGLYAEALEVTTRTLSFDSLNASIYMLRSSAHRGLNQLKESIADLRYAISLEPNNPEYVYNLSFDLLLNEEFEEGWICYETRFQTTNFQKNPFAMVSPRWYGTESLKDRTILVCPEQGLGDQIQFGRYALILKGMGAKVVMPVDPTLVEIMQSLHPDIHICSSMINASSLPHHDFHVPLMSLLGIFKTDLNSIPCAESYLAANDAISYKWAERFAKKSKLQVGITWSGSEIHANDHNRSMTLKQLEPLFSLDIDLHILQTEIRTADAVLLPHIRIKDWRAELSNLHETAGLLEQLDLLITVDTSVAHLSAALGKPTWIMLPYAPDFRWLLHRSSSPWYPSVRLFRQSQPKDWNSLIADVRQALLDTKPN